VFLPGGIMAGGRRVPALFRRGRPRAPGTMRTQAAE
jgi:hypothetical protein